MTRDGCWQVFKDTGDPLCWLLSRAEQEQSGGETESGAAGDEEAPAH